MGWVYCPCANTPVGSCTVCDVHSIVLPQYYLLLGCHLGDLVRRGTNTDVLGVRTGALRCDAGALLAEARTVGGSVTAGGGLSQQQLLQQLAPGTAATGLTDPSITIPTRASISVGTNTATAPILTPLAPSSVQRVNEPWGGVIRSLTPVASEDSSNHDPGSGDASGPLSQLLMDTAAVGGPVTAGRAPCVTATPMLIDRRPTPNAITALAAAAPCPAPVPRRVSTMGSGLLPVTGLAGSLLAGGGLGVVGAVTRRTSSTTSSSRTVPTALAGATAATALAGATAGYGAPAAGSMLATAVPEAGGGTVAVPAVQQQYRCARKRTMYSVTSQHTIAVSRCGTGLRHRHHLQGASLAWSCFHTLA